MRVKTGRELAEICIRKIRECKESLTLRVGGREKAFTRDRKLTAARAVSMIINPAKQSLQRRLYEFGVRFMDGDIATKQAFSKQRQFVNPEYIREYYDETAEELLLNSDLITFKGLHLTAVDGTRIACENTPRLVAEFGCSGPKKDACTALASVAYDVIERVSFGCQIGSYSHSERDLLEKHLDRLEGFGAEEFVIIADRGYPSYDLMETLGFVLRLSEGWTNIISWMDETDDKYFQCEYGGNTYTFRAIKVEMTDKTEYLVTNLDRAFLSSAEAAHIYSLRWNVETFYGFVKTELEMENFSGKTKNAVLQEFYATMTLANICQ
jgi:hypothetical protein